MTPQTNTPQDGGDELGFYELLDVLSGPAGWMADLERIVADEVADAYGEGVVAGRVDEWLKLDKVVNFTGKRHPAVYKLQLPLAYVQTRTKELKALQQPTKPQAGDGDIELTPHYQKVATTRAKSATAEGYEPEFTEVDDEEGA